MHSIPTDHDAADKETVRELRMRFGRGVDKRDFESLATLFTEEIEVDLSQLGVAAGRMSRAAFLDLFRHAFRNEAIQTQQHYGTVLVELSGTTATCWSYLHGWHCLPNDAGGDTFEIRAEYVDQAVKGPNGWRIRGVRINVIAMQGNAALIS